MDSKPKVYTPLVRMLALRFTWELRKTLLSELKLPFAFHEVVERNRIQKDPRICHSHDFCDANVVMSNAFEATLGVEFDLQNDWHISVFEDGWTCAKEMWQHFEPDWVRAMRGLLACPDLNLDELEPQTRAAIVFAENVLDEYERVGDEKD